MDDRPIGIIDSGIGGISILNEVRKYLPCENYIYYADSINNPYGNKPKEEIIKIVDNIIKYFIKYNVKIVIIACNTASTQTISYLRNNYKDILFVAVEPAIKVAYDKYKDKNVLVMATPGTIHSDRLMSLAKEYYQKNRILLPCTNLAELIENENLEEIPIYLDNLFKNIDYNQIEVVILGCTHYPFIKKYIENALNHKVIFVDGDKKKKKRVEFLLQENNVFNNKNNQGTLTIILTKKETENIIRNYLVNNSNVCFKYKDKSSI